MLVRKVLYTMVVFILSAGAAYGERTVSLSEALEIALEQNPEIRATRSAARASREDIGSARSHLLPKVTFEEQYLRTDNPTLAFSSKLNQERFGASDFAVTRLNDPAAIDDWQTSLSVEQPVLARKASIGYRMARTEAEAASVDTERMKEKVIMQVVTSFLNVSSAGDMVGAAEKGVEDAQEHKRIANVLLDAGLGLYSDTLRADVVVKEAEEKLISARKNLRVAKRALGLALGLEEPVGIWGDGIALRPSDLGYYLDAAAERSDIRALALRVQNVRNSVELAKAAYIPVVGVGGAYQFNDPSSPFGGEGESYRVMAFLRWNVFEGNLRSHEREKAEHKLRESEEHLDGLRKKVSFRVHETYLSVQEAAASLELAQSRAALAQEATRLIEARYENALAKIVDVLDAQARLDGARADVVIKQNNYLISLVELSYRSGTIMEDFGGISSE